MNDDNNNVDIDLDEFSNDFFNKGETVATEAPAKEEEVEHEEEAETEDDTLATEQDVVEEEEEEEKPAPTKKKSAQDRINEVVAKQREAERERDLLIAKIAELEAATTKKPKDNTSDGPTQLRDVLDADAPDPDALDEDGSPVYKLGEFDPKYIRDLTKHTIKVEREAAEAEEAQRREAEMIRASQEQLQNSWLEKVKAVEAEIPDLREQITQVEEAFDGIDVDYGEYLAGTIMQCDNGPQIMYYLSQNIDEAKKIVASGPAAATRYLGRLDAKFDKQGSEIRNKKQSSAPAPAPSTTRGSSGKFAVPGDTDNLDAFEKAFYNK